MCFEDRLEQRLADSWTSSSSVRLGDAVARDGVDDREIELLLGGVEIDEQVVDLVQHFLDARIRPVDLVDHHDRRQPRLQRLA